MKCAEHYVSTRRCDDRHIKHTDIVFMNMGTTHHADTARYYDAPYSSEIQEEELWSKNQQANYASAIVISNTLGDGWPSTRSESMIDAPKKRYVIKIREYNSAYFFRMIVSVRLYRYEAYQAKNPLIDLMSCRNKTNSNNTTTLSELLENMCKHQRCSQRTF